MSNTLVPISHYAATIGLADALRSDVIAQYSRRASWAKYLIVPNA